MLQFVILLGLWASATIDSIRRPLGIDEVISTTLIAKLSPFDLLRACFVGAESSPPGFYLVAYPWVKIFGTGEFWLRQMPILCLMLTVWRLLKLLKANHRWSAVIIAVGLVIISSDFLAYHRIDFRPYTLYLLLSVLCLEATLRTLEPGVPRPNAWIVGLLFCLLSYTHVFGVVVGGLLLTGATLYLLVSGRPQGIRALFPAVLGMATIVLWLPAILAQSHQTQISGTFIATPTLGYAMGTIGFESPILALSILVIGAGCLSSPRGFPSNESQMGLDVGSRAVTFLAISMLAIGPVLYLFSIIITPVLLARYAITAKIGAVIIVAGLLSLLLRQCSRKMEVAITAIVVCLCVVQSFRVSGARVDYPEIGELMRAALKEADISSTATMIVIEPLGAWIRGTNEIKSRLVNVVFPSNDKRELPKGAELISLWYANVYDNALGDESVVNLSQLKCSPSPFIVIDYSTHIMIDVKQDFSGARVTPLLAMGDGVAYRIDASGAENCLEKSLP